MAVGYQSFYQAQLTANISDTDTVIPVDVAPTPSEGFLVIESTVTAKREIIYYTSKTTNSVTVPSGAGNGRGYDGTTATSHLQGAAVIMAPVGAMFDELRQQFTTTPQGWTNMVPAVSTVTHNGNRSYDVVFASTVASTLSPGMRLKLERTVAAPTNAFSLDGSDDYYNDTSVSGMTFTDDFSVSGWVYMTAYQVGSIISRYNGTSGFDVRIDLEGNVAVIGYNAGAANFARMKSYQAIPLNRWVHIAVQLDMNTWTSTTTTNYVMIDGVNVPTALDKGGTNPTSLAQLGNLEVGSRNGGTQPFQGYIDQVAIYSAKVTQATHLAAMNQGLTGSETNLISAYSNGSTTDLAATGNNLTAQNGATTVASSWHGDRGTSATLDYALVMNVNGSTVTVQVPEGCTLPTSGGITSVSYSTQANPYGWVSDKGRWVIESLLRTNIGGTAASTSWFYPGTFGVYTPVGTWSISYLIGVRCAASTNSYITNYTGLSTSSSGAANIADSYSYNSLDYGGSATHALEGILTNSLTEYRQTTGGQIYLGGSAAFNGTVIGNGFYGSTSAGKLKLTPSNL